MATLKPASIILGSTQPARLRDWYLKVLAPEQVVDTPDSAHGGEGPIHLDGFILVIEGRDDIDAQNPQPGRVLVNFHVEDFGAAEKQPATVWSADRRVAERCHPPVAASRCNVRVGS
jgi:hypothetical protein